MEKNVGAGSCNGSSARMLGGGCTVEPPLGAGPFGSPNMGEKSSLAAQGGSLGVARLKGVLDL